VNVFLQFLAHIIRKVRFSKKMCKICFRSLVIVNSNDNNNNKIFVERRSAVASTYVVLT